MQLSPDPYFCQLERICASLQRLVSKANLLSCSYPYFPLTFSLWRQQKYAEFFQTFPATDLKLHNQATLKFHEAVDSKPLELFMRKCRDAIALCLVDLKSNQAFASSLNPLKGNREYQDVFEEYSGVVASQLVLLQALTDLATLPYGLSINQSLTVKPIYSAFPVEESNKSFFKRIYDTHAKNIVLKGVGKVGSDLLSKLAVGLAAIAGGINVAGLAGGFLVTQLFEQLGSVVSEGRLVQKLKQQIQRLKASKIALQERYWVCRRLLKEFLSTSKQSQRKLLSGDFETIMKEIFYYDYSHKVLVDEEDEQQGNSIRVIELEEEPWEELS